MGIPQPIIFNFDDHGILRLETAAHLHASPGLTCLDGIQKHIEKTWLSLPGLTEHRRQVLKIGQDLEPACGCFFMIKDLQRGGQGVVEVSLLENGLVEAGEIAQVFDNVADPVEAVQGGGKQARQALVLDREGPFPPPSGPRRPRVRVDACQAGLAFAVFVEQAQGGGERRACNTARLLLT